MNSSAGLNITQHKLFFCKPYQASFVLEPLCKGAPNNALRRNNDYL